jgi:hypothetical protein
MVTLLLFFCLTILEACLPCSGTMYGGTRDVGTLAKMVKGRALLLCVNKGMTEDQVERLLGRPEWKDDSSNGDEAGLVWVRSHWLYSTGLCINFMDEKVSSFSYFRLQSASERRLQ